MKIPFFKPSIGEEEKKAISNVVDSGWLTTGSITKEFEKSFSEDFLNDNSVQSLAVNSCTSGLHLALASAGVGRGDEVITTTHTFTATAEVIIYQGAKPVFVDIESDSFQPSIEKIINAITNKTKAIIIVHFAGEAFPVDKLLKSIDSKISVIEDAAHALPTRFNDGKLVGTSNSTATIFSFYANKTITTGEGGMICTRDPLIAKKLDPCVYMESTEILFFDSKRILQIAGIMTWRQLAISII